MSSLPPREPHVDPHKLSHTGNLQHATHKVSQFAKRDPALYPLSFLVVGCFGVAGYFLMSKASEPEPQKQLVKTGIVNPWDSEDKHDTHPSAVAEFKYRHKTREGHMEDALPALNSEVRQLKENVTSKFQTS